MRRLVCALALAAGLACTASANAQATPPDPDAAFQYDPQTDHPYGAPIREAAQQLQNYYERQQQLNPNHPSFNDAVNEAIVARYGEFQQIVDKSVEQILRTLPKGQVRNNFQQLQAGRDFNSFSREEQQAIVGTMFGTGFGVARVYNRSLESVIVWLGNVLDRVAVQLPEGDPTRQSVRRLIDSAQNRANYTHDQNELDIDRVEGNLTRRQDEVVDRISEEVQRNPDFLRGGSATGEWVIRGTNGQIYINDRGEIGISVDQSAPGGETTFEQREFRTARPGIVTNAERNRIVDYIRANFSENTRGMIQQLDEYIRRINSAQRRGGAGDSGGGRGGAAGGFLPTVFDDFLDNGGTLTTVELARIYEGYNPDDPTQMAISRAGTPNPLRPASEGRSLVAETPSSAPNSLSSVGNSPSLAGTDYRDPGMQAINDALYGLTTRPKRPALCGR